ncbi:MAG: Ig domain-containing protein [Bacilli bacterium]
MREIKVLIGFLVVVFLTGCFSLKEEPLENPTIIPQENQLFLDINPKQINLKVADHFQLYPSVSNAIGPYKIIYSSSNPLVAFVSSEGLIEAKTAGNCTIDVFIEGNTEIKKTIDILVSEKEEISFILTLDGPDTIFVGETVTMQAFDSSNPDNLVFW